MPKDEALLTGQSAQQKQAPFDREVWALRKRQARESVYAMIDSRVQSMGTDGRLFQAYLDVQAHFDLYSVSNAVLIAAQRPEAAKLADFDTWKANGVYVKRGAEAIAILEPGREYKKDDGSVGVFCNVKRVFDISQTTAEQQLSPVINFDPSLLLKALMSNAPCRFVVSNELPEGINAAYHAESRVIYVRQGLDAPTSSPQSSLHSLRPGGQSSQRSLVAPLPTRSYDLVGALFRGLAQELARAHMVRGGIACESPDFTVYSVSYLLCRRSGVPVEGFSFDRLPESYATMDAKTLRAELGTMRSVAGSITADMNRFFAAQEKTQKNRSAEAR